MKSCWFHDWTKWEEFEKVSHVVKVIYGQKIEGKDHTLMQRRHCLKCGYKVQKEGSYY